MKHFAVFGNPVAHSKSPEIHATFAAQFGIELEYERLLVDADAFIPNALRFFEHGAGANVTVPFKEDALRFADELSEAARLAGAVNTLSRQGNVVKGDNTDGIGLVRDIRDNHGVSFFDKRVLIIGAGGASRGVILPIAKEKPTGITIVNRTEAKAQCLAEVFSPYVMTNALTFDALNAQEKSYDIIINATSASLSGQGLNLSIAIFAPNTLAYDMMYGKAPTSFMTFAQESGATALDGLGMLIEQAAKSFEIWHGVIPETGEVIKIIRDNL